MTTKRKCKSEPKFEVGFAGNEVLSGKGFFISYREDTSAVDDELDMLKPVAKLFGDLLPPVNDGIETAIVSGKGRKIYRILRGDFRKQYLKVFSQGEAACIRLFDKHKATHGSGWSTLDEDRPS